MATAPTTSKGSVDDEEDDYMSMAIVEPTKPKEKETYTQRRIRKEREVLSALTTSLDSHNLTDRLS